MLDTRSHLVSIGVPTYNRVEKLKRSLPRMQAQEHQNIEIVISDNASTDGTREYCEEAARSDPRIRYHRQSRNIGPALNYGEVLRLATGEFYMHLADDDDLADSYVSKCLSTLLADPALTMVGGRPLMYRDGTLERESVLTDLLDSSPSRRVLQYYATVVDNGAFHGIARRQVLSSLPPLRDRVMGGDWLWMASIAFTGPIKTATETSVVKHMGGATTSMQHVARALGLSPLRGRYWLESIMMSVFSDIAWESPVYASLGSRRVALAAAAVGVIAKRHDKRWRSAAFARMVAADLIPRPLHGPIKALLRTSPS